MLSQRSKLGERYYADSICRYTRGSKINCNRGRLINFLENKLERRLIWLICALLTNELPIKHLMAELDIKNTSNNAFSGPVRKIVDKVTNFRVRDSIPKLNVKIELIELRDVLKSLSHNQKYLYDITWAIKVDFFLNI